MSGQPARWRCVKRGRDAATPFEGGRIEQYDLFAVHIKHAFPVELREAATHSLHCEPEVLRDVTAVHAQVEIVR